MADPWCYEWTDPVSGLKREGWADHKAGGKSTKLICLYSKILVLRSTPLRAFSQDSSHCLLTSLRISGWYENWKRKVDIFNKRTIRRAETVTSVDTASEALCGLHCERAGVDLSYMAQLSVENRRGAYRRTGRGDSKNWIGEKWEPSDDHLSGNVRENCRSQNSLQKITRNIRWMRSDGEQVAAKRSGCIRLRQDLGQPGPWGLHYTVHGRNIPYTKILCRSKVSPVCWSDWTMELLVDKNVDKSYGNEHFVTSTYGT